MVEFNNSTPMRTQMEVMASTGVLVSVHTSNLANAQFLPPGSAVVELIQRNWIWHNLDKSFQVGGEGVELIQVGRGGGTRDPRAPSRPAAHIPTPPVLPTPCPLHDTTPAWCSCKMMGDIHHLCVPTPHHAPPSLPTPHRAPHPVCCRCKPR